MRTVYKYPLQVNDDKQSFQLPKSARIVCVMEQRNKPTMWVELEENEPYVTRSFVIHGTGHHINAEEQYVGSCMTHGELFVWHVYEVIQ